MKRIHILAAATTIIGVFSVLVFFLEAMALTDIFHGEQDVRLEWQIVSYAQLPMFAFHLLALGLSISTFGFLKTRDSAKLMPYLMVCRIPCFIIPCFYNAYGFNVKTWRCAWLFGIIFALDLRIVKGGAKSRRVAGRNKTAALPGDFCENNIFFAAV